MSSGSRTPRGRSTRTPKHLATASGDRRSSGHNPDAGQSRADSSHQDTGSHAAPAPKIERERLDLDVDPEGLARVNGPLDAHLRLIERRLGVEIRNRERHFEVLGQEPWPRVTAAVLRELAVMAAEHPVEIDAVHAALQSAHVDALAAGAGQPLRGATLSSAPPLEAAPGALRLRRAVIRGRGPRQQSYLAAIGQHPLNFGVGPAGTGKTYLAVAAAVAAIESSQVRRLVLVRPAVEAGERLGFLPGDLAQKIDPYLRPMYDALYDLLGAEQTVRMQERGVIEVAPLAYMRGRTLNEAFIILDEAQNTSVEQMKMFLTRIGFGSTAVVNGDPTQNDLPRGQRSGLEHALAILEGVEGVAITRFVAADVVRHPLVQRIVEAYERAAPSDSAGGRPRPATRRTPAPSGGAGEDASVTGLPAADEDRRGPGGDA